MANTPKFITGGAFSDILYVLVYKQGPKVEEAIIDTSMGPSCLNLQIFLCFSIEAAVFNITVHIYSDTTERGVAEKKTHCPSFSWQKWCTSSPPLFLEVNRQDRLDREENETQ